MQSGIAFSYSRARVCRPVMSPVNANSPFPTVNGDNGSSCRRMGLCRETNMGRWIVEVELDDCPSENSDRPVPSTPPATESVFRKFRREIIVYKTSGTDRPEWPAVPDSLLPYCPPGLEDELEHHLHSSWVVCLSTRSERAEIAGGRIHLNRGATEEPGVI